MPDPFGQLLTRWTIRLALVCYVACLAALLLRRGKPAPMRPMVRWLWTLGCGLFVTHVICAFGFYHHFSHLAAYEDTARQTEEMLGFAFGEGIYFSYLFTLLWIADVAWRWSSPLSRPAWLDWPLHAYMFFIAFNGAIVFEGGMSRWGGIAACVLLAFVAGRRVWSRLPRPEREGTMG
jgi:hypothetical protein